MEQLAGQGPGGELLVLGSVSSCVFRRADGASGCHRAKYRDVNVKNCKDRALTGYLLCRAFLLCFCCLHLCSLYQWELVLPDLSLSSVWIILSSAFSSFASPAALVWMPGSRHRWPSSHP